MGRVLSSTSVWLAEPCVSCQQVLEVRRQEMRQLAIIKLLDAFCVFSWACTSLLFAVFTFSLYAALDHRLEPTLVFTTVRDPIPQSLVLLQLSSGTVEPPQYLAYVFCA